jgi:hypothetical protein
MYKINIASIYFIRAVEDYPVAAMRDSFAWDVEDFF